MSKANIVDIHSATNAEANNKLRHDLMAPVCNIKAYTNELKQVAKDIEALLLEHKDAIPESVASSLRNVGIADIDICTNALDRSTKSLDAQLQVIFNDTKRS